MNERFDRFDLAGRLERFADKLMTACEQGAAIENRIDVCAQAGTVCRIALTLKSLRMEDRNADPDAAIAGSAVKKYRDAFRSGGVAQRTALAYPDELDTDDDSDDPAGIS